MQSGTKNAFVGSMLAYFILVPILAIIKTPLEAESYLDPAVVVAILLVALIEALAIGLIAYVFMTISPLDWFSSVGMNRAAKNVIIGAVIGAIILSIPSLWGLESNPRGLGEILLERLFVIFAVGISGVIFAKYNLLWSE